MQDQDLQRFFDGLTPRLETARVLEDELDRQLARRFNALDYLRTDEMGLSRIIADLLDPKGKHSQGDVFLRLLLDRLDFEASGRLGAAHVSVEHPIKDSRRLDVCVDMDGKRCLAVENKPYAGDQPNQIKDYLDWLKSKYERFLLIYLSPRGEPPSAESVESRFLIELGQELGRDEYFRIMPYHKTQGTWEDEFDRLDFSLADWLADCRRSCDVERLRWFLREAETFCTRAIGGQAVAGSEVSALREFLFADEKNWESALKIERALPDIKNEVSEAFLWKVWQTWPEDRNVYPDDMTGYVRALSRCTLLSMYSESWKSAENWSSGRNQDENTQLRLETTPSRDWYIGVCSKHLPKDGRSELSEALGKGEPADGSWLWWQWVDKEYRSWDDLIPTLRRECAEDEEGGVEGAKVLKYFVEKFAEIAKVAIPIIEKYEGARERTS